MFWKRMSSMSLRPIVASRPRASRGQTGRAPTGGSPSTPHPSAPSAIDVAGVQRDVRLTAPGQSWRSKLRLRAGLAVPGLALLLRELLARDRRRRFGRRLAVEAVEDAFEVVALDGLLFEQDLHEPVQPLPVLDQQAARGLVRVVDEAAHLFVDLLGDLLAVVPLLGDLPAEEHELLLVTERPRAEALAHAPLRDH